MHFNDDASRTKVLEKVVRYILIFVEFLSPRKPNVCTSTKFCLLCWNKPGNYSYPHLLLSWHKEPNLEATAFISGVPWSKLNQHQSVQSSVASTHCNSNGNGLWFRFIYWTTLVLSVFLNWFHIDFFKGRETTNFPIKLKYSISLFSLYLLLLFVSTSKSWFLYFFRLFFFDWMTTPRQRVIEATWSSLCSSTMHRLAAVVRHSHCLSSLCWLVSHWFS